MGQTQHYHLFITDDNTTTFQSWRRKVAGTGNDSNMKIIDNELYSRYKLPENGIPLSDLSTQVKDTIGRVYVTTSSVGSGLQASLKSSEIYTLKQNHLNVYIVVGGTEFPLADFEPPYAVFSGVRFNSDDQRFYLVTYFVDNDSNVTSTYSVINKSNVQTATLTSFGWQGNTQTVTVQGISSDESEQLITVIPTTSFRDTYYNCGIMCISQAENSLTFRANTVPNNSISIRVAIQEI